MAFDPVSRTYNMQDPTGYGWLFENLDPVDYIDMGRQELEAWFNPLIDTAIEIQIASHENLASKFTYPMTGYMTTIVYADYDEYMTAKRAQLESELRGDLDNMIEAYNAWMLEAFPSLTQRVLAAPVVEALEVDLDMLDGMEDDGGVIPSFDDNGGEPDGNVLLTTDYTAAQRAILIERGATIRRVAKLSYLWRDQQVTKPTEAHKDELEASCFRWCGMQVAGEALVIVSATGIENVSVPPTAMSKSFPTAYEAKKALKEVSSSVKQSIGDEFSRTLGELVYWRLTRQVENHPKSQPNQPAIFVGANGFRYVTSGKLEYGIIHEGEQYVAFINHPSQWHYFSTLFASAWLNGFRPMGGVPYHYDDYTARAVLAVASMTFDGHHMLLGGDKTAARMLVAHIAGVLKNADETHNAKIEAANQHEEERKREHKAGQRGVDNGISSLLFQGEIAEPELQTLPPTYATLEEAKAHADAHAVNSSFKFYAVKKYEHDFGYGFSATNEYRDGQVIHRPHNMPAYQVVAVGKRESLLDLLTWRDIPRKSPE